MAAVGTQLGLVGYAKARFSSGIRLPEEGSFPSLSGATAWLNSPPLMAPSLRGKVVLADFWTYTCVNWRRTLPYVRAWAEKYRGRGLVVIGVHTPEFSFEHNIDNVRWALQDMKIDYPIAIDNDYAIWHAFNNEYWPASYFIDVKGKVRHHQFGEGDYEQSEAVIQQLLSEAGGGAIDPGSVSVAARGAEVAADRATLKSPETYVGHAQTENFSSPGRTYLDKPHVYAFPGRLDLNQWALAGDWTVGKEAVTLNQPSGRIRTTTKLDRQRQKREPCAMLRVRAEPLHADKGLTREAKPSGYPTARNIAVAGLACQPRPIASRTKFAMPV